MLTIANLQTFIGAAPAHSDFGCMDCSSSTDWLWSGVGFVFIVLMAFIVPFHLGSIRATHCKENPSLKPPRVGRAMACATPAWLCAMMILLAREYSPEALLAWLVGVVYLTAALSWTSGFRWRFADASGPLAVASIAMGLSSLFLFIGVGWPLTLSLPLSLWVSVMLDLPSSARAQLPTWWNARHVPFVVLASFAALLLGLGGPSWIG
jgi:hypothetical protein